MSNTDPTSYDDGAIRCDGEGVSIRCYYPWGAKRIAYASIRGVETLSLTGANKVRRWRIWGSGDFVHWWNLDTRRPSKTAALVLDVGGRVRPTITPDDPPAVARILTDRIG
ncbi:hypothetical protein [Streptacidiphilus jiangxiensis]|uniref:PH domain-containing protein n=1 Tax=Streptacidiphilus jiangxiensis TaxID=235985 RepID=A0A1H7QWZ3_STRJI|nr:hypothetical protein [Streptacidiphilus jiangxiensis]SEL52214.1 hypothetical protein SAMN05414137_109250 [Streptacidiphilus jiangxiensis]